MTSVESVPSAPCTKTGETSFAPTTYNTNIQETINNELKIEIRISLTWHTWSKHWAVRHAQFKASRTCNNQLEDSSFEDHRSIAQVLSLQATNAKQVNVFTTIEKHSNWPKRTTYYVLTVTILFQLSEKHIYLRLVSTNSRAILDVFRPAFAIVSIEGNELDARIHN